MGIGRLISVMYYGVVLEGVWGLGEVIVDYGVDCMVVNVVDGDVVLVLLCVEL